MLYQTEGIVLSANDLGENDRLILVLTREEGTVSAVVKGARKPKSKLAAVTQPYTRAVFQLFRGKSLDRVTQVAYRTTHPGIMLDYGKMVYAGFVSELLSCVMPERERNDAMFELFGRVLSGLEEREDPWPVAVWGALGVLVRGGFGPSFGKCAVCGGAVEGPVRFSVTSGGVLCGRCAAPARDPGAVKEILPGTARILDILAVSSSRDGSCPPVNARGKVREEALQVLLRYAESILGRRLRSSSLVESIEVEQHLKE